MHTVGVKAVLILVEEYYQWFSRGLDMYSGTSPYGVPLSDRFLGNASERVQNRLKVYGYKVPPIYHSTTN